MRTITAGWMLLFALPASAQERLPIIDMHLHALAADENGPPPLALCIPIPEFPVRDPGTVGRDLHRVAEEATVP